MELTLSLGDASQSFCRPEKSPNQSHDFSGVLSDGDDGRPVPRDLLPFAPVLPNPSSRSYASFHQFLSANNADLASESRPWRSFDVNLSPEEETHMAMSNEGEPDRTSSRGSDDDESCVTRRKLRLSREQSAFLEESFNEHHTLNPKQKSALARQLNLRPRQVEVWFQNRRARTKLKQTEVDCEYLRRICEALAQENRRLQKEVQELRALKSAQPFYSRLPPTTLTICPSCERSASIAAGSSFSTPSSRAGNPSASSIGTRTHGIHHIASSQKQMNLQS